MSEFKIDNGIPIPLKCSNRKNGHSKYNLHLMEVGDSIFFSFPSGDRKKYLNISSNISQIARKQNKRFCMRSVDGGVRVWRIE